MSGMLTQVLLLFGVGEKSYFLCFAHVSRELLEPRSVAGFCHIQSVRRLVALIDDYVKVLPTIPYFISWRALINLVVLSMSPYSCLLFQMCRS